jgi:acylphosphatase
VGSAAADRWGSAIPRSCLQPNTDKNRARHDGDMTQVRMTAWVHGRVQGVGFRWWTRSRALELGLVGHAANLSDGRVEVVAEGPREACERLLAALRSGSTPGQVQRVTERFVDARGGVTGFVER